MSDYEELYWEYFSDEQDGAIDEEESAGFEGQPEVVNVADEHPGFLVLRGEHSGSVLNSPPANALTRKGTAPRIPTRDEALDGSMPLMLLTAGQKSSSDGREVLTALHAEHGRYLRLGVSAGIPRHTPKKIKELFDCSVAAVRIVDPEYYLIEHDKLLLKSDNPDDYKNDEQGAEAQRAASRRRGQAPYLGRRGTSSFVREIVEAQREYGANLLLTSGSAIDASDVERSVSDLIREGEEVLALLRGDERMALNVTLPWDCLVNQQYIETILGELLEQDQFDAWYVRAQWRNSPEGPHLRDSTALRAYKDLCNLASEEERSVILPQTGLTGWYLIAHGALGFGTGTAGSDQAFVQYRRAMRQPGSSPVQYFFERDLLHAVEFPTHMRIREEEGYVGCTCRYCEAIEQSGLFTGRLAQWHGVFNHGAAAAEIQRSSRRSGRAGAARRILRRAEGLTKKLALVGRDDPKHLATWLQLL